MRKLWLAICMVLGGLGLAIAQSTFTMPPPAGVALIGVQAVTSCGGASLTNGNTAFVTMDLTGKLCTNASGTGVTNYALETGGNLATIATNTAAAIPAGTNYIDQVGIGPQTTGGLTTYFLQPTAADNHTNVKNGAGQVYWVLVENNSATVNYLRFYNAATGFNGCNSATNLVSQIQIPASTAVGGVNISVPLGIPFSTGISICVTSGYATTDTTNATASAMSLTIGYN